MIINAKVTADNADKRIVHVHIKMTKLFYDDIIGGRWSMNVVEKIEHFKRYEDNHV